MALGNTSVSSLIKSTESARKQQQRYEDRVEKFYYDSSAKTGADLERYLSHIDSRRQTTSDPSDLLSLATTERTAIRTFSSHQIQRASQSVLDGTGSLPEKRGALQDLYADAQFNGDLDLAQSLYGQLLQVDAAIDRAASAQASRQARLWKDRAGEVEELTLADLEENRAAVNDLFKLKGANQFELVAREALLDSGVLQGAIERGDLPPEILTEKGLTVGYFDAQLAITKDAIDSLKNEIALNPEFDARNRLIDKVNDILEKGVPLPEGSSVSSIPIEKAETYADMEREGYSPFREVAKVSKDGLNTTFALEFQKVGDYTYTRGADGKYKVIPVPEPRHDFGGTDLSSLSKREQDEIKNRLEDLGYQVGEVENGLLTISQTEKSFRASGLPGFVRRVPGAAGDTFNIDSPIPQSLNVVVGEDGNIRFTTPDADYAGKRIFELDMETGRVAESLPDEVKATFDQYLDRNNLISEQRVERLRQSLGGDGSFGTRSLIAAAEAQLRQQQQRFDVRETIKQGTPTVQVTGKLDPLPEPGSGTASLGTKEKPAPKPTAGTFTGGIASAIRQALGVSTPPEEEKPALGSVSLGVKRG